MEVRQGDVASNTRNIIRMMAQARADGVRLVVFPELAVSGILMAADWLDTTLLRECEASITRIIAESVGIAVIFGAPVRLPNGLITNAVVVAENGTLLGTHHKRLSRQNRFDRATGLACATEAASPSSPPFTFRHGGDALTVQVVDDTESVTTTRPDLFVTLTSAPYVRNVTPRTYSGTLPLARCSAVGLVDMGKTVFILEGASCCVMPDGAKVTAPRFVESTCDLPVADVPPSRPIADTLTVIEAIETACARHLQRQRLSRVVIGASGGIDSALSAAIYARVVGAENVLLVNMPSRHNSQTTVTLARQLADRLGTYYAEIPIDESVGLTCRQIAGLVCQRPSASPLTLSLSPSAIENVQARDRSGRILAALASAWGGVFTCNANKSEATIGYGTMYGDLAGFFATLADLWKTEVWEIAACYNKEIFGSEIIPQGSIDLVPSAELSAEQNVDEGKGDPLFYPWHDKLFASWTELTPPMTLEDEPDWHEEGRRRFPTPALFRADTEKLWALFTGLARAKRLQAPPVLSLKNRTFGFDLR